MPSKSKSENPAPSYAGLAEAWEGNPAIRRYVLENKKLVEWLSPKMAGVVTMETIKKNTVVLKELLKVYLPLAPKAKTCNVDALKAEALGFSKLSIEA